MNPIPTGTQAKIDGLYYKIGRHGKPYRHNGDEWITSTKPIHEVSAAIEHKNNAHVITGHGQC